MLRSLEVSLKEGLKSTPPNPSISQEDSEAQMTSGFPEATH